MYTKYVSRKRASIKSEVPFITLIIVALFTMLMVNKPATAQEPTYTLEFGTYFGSDSDTYINSIALDQQGNIYIGGQTTSTSLPVTPGAFQTTNRGDQDGFIAKLSPGGETLLYCTYLGGNRVDSVQNIAVDNSGELHIVGITWSTDFPTSTNAYDTTLGGGRDAFVAKFDANWKRIYSTYFGGDSWEYGFALTTDDQGNTYFGGFSHGGIPTTSGVIQPNPNGDTDGYVAKLNPKGNLIFSTYVATSINDSVTGLAVDSSYNIYIAHERNLTKLNPMATAFLYQTPVPTGFYGNNVTIDQSGNAYFTGIIDSSSFPATPNALQATFGGGATDVGIVKLDPTGAIVYSSYFGGDGEDRVDYRMAMNVAGEIYITGTTSSTNFPLTNKVFDTIKNGTYDSFMAKIDLNSNKLLYSTYLGGSADEVNDVSRPSGITIDSSNHVYLAETTNSTDFPTTSGAYDITYNGGKDGFVAKFKVAQTETDCGGVTNGLIACYPLDGDTKDYSGNGNHGATMGPTNYTTGFKDQAIHTDYGGRVEIAMTDMLSKTLSGDFTIAGWFKTPSGWEHVGIGHNISGDEEAGKMGLQLSCSSGDTPDRRNLANIGIWGSNPTNYVGIIGNTVTCDNNWHFTVMTVQGATMTLYVDGQDNSSTDISGAGSRSVGNIPLVIGSDRSGGGTGRYLEGEADEIRLYNRALTEGEMKQLYGTIAILTVTKSGNGTITGQGIDCSTDCTEAYIVKAYIANTKITLTATPATDSTFKQWTGDCSGTTTTVTVTMDQAKACTATFVTPVPVVTPPPVTATPPPVTPPETIQPAVTTPPVTMVTTDNVSSSSQTPPLTTETMSNVSTATPTTTPVGTTQPQVATTPPVVTATFVTPVVTPPPATPTPPVNPTMPVVTPPAPPPEMTPLAVTTPPVTMVTTGNVSSSSPTPPVTTETMNNVPTATPTTTPVETTQPPVATTPPVVTTAPVEVTPPPVVTLLPVLITGANFSCSPTGDIGEVCNYSGREVTDLNVQGSGIVSNAKVSTTVVNHGWVSNFTITATGKLSGGVVTGYIKNDGLMLDFEFVGMSIIGGTLGGTIRNNSKVGGYFQDVTLLAGTKITGGSLKGTIKGDKKSPALLEKVRVKKGSKLSGVKLGKEVKLEKGVMVE